MTDQITKTDDQWREQLTPEQYEILRRKGTEPPGTGQYTYTKDTGMYQCAACGADLFSSDTKFDSGSGWPSFTKPANLQNIELHEDNGFLMKRTEVTCKRCGGHLGHVFDDGPSERGGQRYCINSVALNLERRAENS